MGAISFKASEVKNLHHYDIIKKDPNRGCYQFINKANGQEMLVRELQLGRDAQSLPEMESLLQRAMMMQHDNIVALKDFFIDQAMGSAACLYQYPLRSLFDERAQRQMFNTPYKQNELWSVVQGLAMGMNYLSKNGVRNDCLRLQTIMLASNGTVKIADPAIIRTETNYQLCLVYPGSFFPLSPAQLEALSGNRSRATFSNSKDQVFCAGVVLLELALIGLRHMLQPPSQPQAYSNSISQGLKFCSDRYSPEFLAALGFMLQFNEKERASWSDLVELLQSSNHTSGERNSYNKTAGYTSDIIPRGSFGRTPQLVVNVPNELKRGAADRSRSLLTTNRFTSQLSEDRSKPAGSSALYQPPKVVMSFGNTPKSNIVQPQTRVNQSTSEAFLPKKKEEVSAADSQPTIRTNRILASNITRQRSLGGRAFSTNPIDPIRYSSSQQQWTRSGNYPVFGQPVNQNPSATPQQNQWATNKPPTAVSNFPVSEEIRQTSAQQSGSSGQPTPINSIIVQERGFDLLGNRIYRQVQPPAEDDLKIVPTTFSEASYPAERPTVDQPPRSEGLFEKRLPTVRSYKQLGGQTLPNDNKVTQSNHQPELQAPAMEVGTVVEHELRPSYLGLNGECDFQRKISIEQTIVVDADNAPRGMERLKEVNAVIIESKLIEKIPSIRSESTRQWYQPVLETAGPAMSMAYDGMIQSTEWNELFRKTQTSKISVQVQTSPAKAKEVANSRRPERSRSPTKAVETRERNLQQSLKTVKVSYEQPTRVDITQVDSPRRQFQKFEPLIQKNSYEGETLRGFRHGFGRYYFEDGGYYEGQWNFNRMQGKGKLYYASGKMAYQGLWSQDQIHGYGKLYNENPRFVQLFDYKDFTRLGNYWSTYQGTNICHIGNFELDQKSGSGTLTLCNGETYSGHFEADHVHGQGVFRGRNRAVHGIWERGLLKSVL